MILMVVLWSKKTTAWIHSTPHTPVITCGSRNTAAFVELTYLLATKNNENEEEDKGMIEEYSDFADLGYIVGDESSPITSTRKEDDNSKYIPSEDDIVPDGDSQLTNFAQLFQERSGSIDWTAIQTRQFSLGRDLLLTEYVGNMGFDEVTDWEYYYPSEDGDDRQVVQPNPLDSSK